MEDLEIQKDKLPRPLGNRLECRGYSSLPDPFGPNGVSGQIRLLTVCWTSKVRCLNRVVYPRRPPNHVLLLAVVPPVLWTQGFCESPVARRA